MTSLIKATAGLLLLTGMVGLTTLKTRSTPAPVLSPGRAPAKIQVAILLDVSNSMDGLIGQAKAQLWNMVSVMGKAKCDGITPQIEIALYEYGSPRNNVKEGYVKQISDFSTDLDQLSKKLFALTTNGGDEYCGHAIYSSIDELNWDTSSKAYKVIFIAGNEDFLQGDIQYSQACTAANKKGVIVNTIYCGDRAQGIKEHWNLLGECGNGSYSNINQDAKEEEIPTPYDSTLIVLNSKLNTTYLAYGYEKDSRIYELVEVDKLNSNASVAQGIKRTKVKANANLYRNSSWDLVDASTDDSTFISKVDMNSLPDSLRNKSRGDLSRIVNAKKEERSAIQKQIETVSTTRENYIIEQKKKNASNTNVQTLETETEKMIRQQAKRFNMIID